MEVLTPEAFEQAATPLPHTHGRDQQSARGAILPSWEHGSDDWAVDSWEGAPQHVWVVVVRPG